MLIRTILLTAFLALSVTAQAQSKHKKHLQASDLVGKVKYGLFSGTFDPPTISHNQIIRHAIKTFNLDMLYIYVNKYGRKTCKCSSEQRVKMLERMLCDIGCKVAIFPQITPNRATDYALIKKLLCNKKILHIMGQDSYESRLAGPRKGRSKCDYIAVIPRSSQSSNSQLKLGHNAFRFDIPTDNLLDISSTNVRKKLEQKDYSNIDLTPEVLNYIRANSMYQALRNNIEQQNKEEFQKLYHDTAEKRRKTCPTPTFDPLSNPNAWAEQIENYVITNQS